MIDLKDLQAFILQTYKYGNAKDKVRTYLSHEEIDDIRHGFYNDLSNDEEIVSLYDLALERVKEKDVIEYEGTEVDIDNDISINNEPNQYCWGVYEIITEKVTFYLAELYDEEDHYSRCDFYFNRIGVDKYLQDVFHHDQKHFPPDLVIYL